MRWVADLDGLMIPESSTSTKTEQGGSALVAHAGRGLKSLGVRSRIESATIPEGKSHVQKEDFTKHPVSMREQKEVQELLLW